MESRLADRTFGCVVALVVWSLTGCPSLDQLRAGPDGEPGDADAGQREGGKPEPDGGETVTTDADLVGKWDFDGTGLVAEDSSGNGHHAELVAGATQESGVGIRGGALVLHGLDNANVPSLAGDAFPRTGTMALWLRYAEKSGDFGVFDDFDSAREHFFLRRRPGDEGKLQVAFQVTPDPGDYAWERTISAAEATWVHIAVTWNEPGQSAAVWVNGGLAHDGAFGRDFAFGEQRVVLGGKLEGAIDELRIYETVLSGARIKALATRPR